MKRIKAAAGITFVLLFVATSAYAFSLAGIKSWVGWQGAAYILTGILAIGAIGGTIMFTRIIQTLKEMGELMVYISTSVGDRKLTADELKQLVKETRDVVNIWAKTPDKFVPNA